MGPFSLLNEPSHGRQAHFVISKVPRGPLGAADEVSLSPSDRPAIPVSVCAAHVLAAAQAYADTGEVAKGFSEGALGGTSTQINRAAVHPSLFAKEKS